MAVVLLIDDDATNRALGKFHLESGGHAVTLAAGGADALEQLERTLPDLILCDLVMPVLDGAGVLKAVRSEPRTSTLPFVCMSSDVRPETVAQCLRQGANDFVPKPINRAALLAVVSRALEAGQTPAKVAALPASPVEAANPSAEDLAFRLERLERALAESNMCIWEVDTLTQGIYLSAGWARFLGTGNSETHTTVAALGAISHPEDLPDVVRLQLETLKGMREEYAIEQRMRTASGEWKWVLSRGRVSLRDPATGQALRLSGTNMDISERRGVEHALAAARDAAEAANRAKSAFLATMSHEIRTPMNGVIGMTSLLLETSLTEEQTEYSQTIRTSAEALLAVINDVLDYSKIEAGKIDLEESEFDLGSMIEEVLDLVAPAAREARVELLYTIAPQVPRRLRSDATRLRQILVNLCSNAVKFTAQGSVSIRVALGDGDGDSDGAPEHIPQRAADVFQLCFDVIDTGVGIPVDALDRLFKPFSQADSSTTRRYGGTGLGLAICTRLTALLGGRIWVDSAPGLGSTFHFTIATRAGAEAARPASAAAHQLAGLHALVVDDVSEIRDVIALHLKRAGMQVRTAVSAEEALAILAQPQPFDVMVIDLYLTGMSGIELARSIRNMPTRAHLPLIAVSSMKRSTLGVDRDLFNAHLLKPVRAELLLTALDRALDQRSGTTANDNLSQPASKTRAPRPSHTGLRVLVADDNRVNQRVATKMLEQLGIRADVANDGAEVLSILETREYDIILMDVQMPDVDGLEATRRIIAKFGERRPRIIALTANAMRGDRERFLATGMDDYLAKPLLAPDLQAALARQNGAGDLPVANPAPVALDVFTPDAATPVVHTAPINKQVFDTLRVMFGSDLPAISELVRTFIADTLEIGKQMADAQRGSDFEALRTLAHKLKGSAGAVGADRLEKLASALEICARIKESADCQHYLQQVNAALPATQQMFEELLGSPVAAPA